MLIVDAKNAYNNLNRIEALIIAKRIVPEVFATFKNFYGENSRAFFHNQEIRIEEGCLQGCALSSIFYDIGIKKMVDNMLDENVNQTWLADDLAAAGEPEQLRQWYIKLVNEGAKWDTTQNPKNLG